MKTSNFSIRLVHGVVVACGLFAGPAMAQLTFEMLPAGDGLTAMGEVGAISTDGSRIGGKALRVSSWSEEAFVWDAGAGMRSVHPGLDLPARSMTHGVSDSGTVVAGWSLSVDEGLFCWVDGSSTVLSGFPGKSVFALSRDGAYAVGRSPLSRGSAEMQAVRWPAAGGSFSALGDLDGGATDAQATAVSTNGQVVAGWGTSAGGREAFRWEGGTMEGLGDLPGGRDFSEATAVSGDGSKVVGRSASANGIEAFRWTQTGGIEGLGDLPGGFVFSEAFGVSDDGQLIVGVSHSGRGHEIFLHDDISGMRSLLGLMRHSGIDLSGWKFDQCQPVLSGDGDVLAGSAMNDQLEQVLWRIGGIRSIVGVTPVSPVAVGCSESGDDVCVTIWTEAGFGYQVETSLDCGCDDPWIALGPAIVGDGLEKVVATALIPEDKSRFYRLVITPLGP